MKAIEIDKALSRIPPNATMKVLGRMVTRKLRDPTNRCNGYYFHVQHAEKPYSRHDAVTFLLKNGDHD